jgi:hypothetical protein
MSVDLYKELRELLKKHQFMLGICLIEEVTAVISRYTEIDLQQAVLLQDSMGNLLLHYACYDDASVEVVQLLLDVEVENKSIYQKNCTGWLPIHAACMRHSSIDNVRLLIDRDTDKQSLLVKDIGGRVPLFSSCDEGYNVEVTKLLLKTILCDRIERLGSTPWKLVVKQLISNMTGDDSLPYEYIYERTTNSHDEIYDVYLRLSKYETKRNLFLLTLAVWRTSCLHWGTFQFTSMDEIECFRMTDCTFDPAKYKQERRIKSQADVIIQGVLPFMPITEDMLVPPDHESEFHAVSLEMDTHPDL